MAAEQRSTWGVWHKVSPSYYGGTEELFGVLRTVGIGKDQYAEYLTDSHGRKVHFRSRAGAQKRADALNCANE